MSMTISGAPLMNFTTRPSLMFRAVVLMYLVWVLKGSREMMSHSDLRMA